MPTTLCLSPLVSFGIARARSNFTGWQQWCNFEQQTCIRVSSTSLDAAVDSVLQLGYGTTTIWECGIRRSWRRKCQWTSGADVCPDHWNNNNLITSHGQIRWSGNIKAKNTANKCATSYGRKDDSQDFEHISDVWLVLFAPEPGSHRRCRPPLARFPRCKHLLFGSRSYATRLDGDSDW